MVGTFSGLAIIGFAQGDLVAQMQASMVDLGVGTWAAGLIVDNYNPNWVWYLSGIISAIAATGFLALYHATRRRLALAESAPEPSTEVVESHADVA